MFLQSCCKICEKAHSSRNSISFLCKVLWKKWLPEQRLISSILIKQFSFFGHQHPWKIVFHHNNCIALLNFWFISFCERICAQLRSAAHETTKTFYLLRKKEMEDVIKDRKLQVSFFQAYFSSEIEVLANICSHSFHFTCELDVLIPINIGIFLKAHQFFHERATNTLNIFPSLLGNCVN